MEQSTQFHHLYQKRVEALRGRQASPGAVRWRIWNKQVSQGKTPCFGTEARNSCRHFDCPWRQECMALRAEWQR